MQQKARKLWGTLAIIALLIVYPLAVMELYATTMIGLPWWGGDAGLVWIACGNAALALLAVALLRRSRARERGSLA